MQLRDALEARELIKVSLLNNFSGKKEEAAEQLVKGTGAELVQLIGRTVVLYKESREKRRIELPD